MKVRIVSVLVLVVLTVLSPIFLLSPQAQAGKDWEDDLATMQPGDGWSFNVYAHSVRVIWFKNTDPSVTIRLFVKHNNKGLGHYYKDTVLVGSIYSPEQIVELTKDITIEPKGRLSPCTEGEKRMFRGCDAKWVGGKNIQGKWLLTLRNNTGDDDYVFVWIEAEK